MSTLLKQSLLLTHGTVYGQIISLSHIDLTNKTPNIDQWDDPDYDWKNGLFEKYILTTMATGTVTDNTPIDLVSWSDSGVFAPSPMASWSNCIKILRHI